MLKRRNNLGGIANKPGVSLPYVGVVLMLSEWVDFHWEVDGKVYEFTLPGGGFVSFEALMEVLHVAGIDQEDRAADSENEELASDKLTLNEISISEETEKLVADVTQVEFSSPDLVWVHKIKLSQNAGL